MGDVLDNVGTVLLTLLIMLLSKGWMITRVDIKRKTKIFQFIITVGLMLLYGLLFVFELTSRDPAATYHPYETSTARVIIVVRLILFAWFGWCVRRTLSQEQREEFRRFYGTFAPVGGWWLLSLPAYSLVVFMFSAVYQLLVISIAVTCTNFATLLFVSTLTLPKHIAPLSVVEAHPELALGVRSGIIAPAPPSPTRTRTTDGDAATSQGGASAPGCDPAGAPAAGAAPSSEEGACRQSGRMPSRSKRIHAPSRTALSEM